MRTTVLLYQQRWLSFPIAPQDIVESEEVNSEIDRILPRMWMLLPMQSIRLPTYLDIGIGEDWHFIESRNFGLLLLLRKYTAKGNAGTLHTHAFYACLSSVRMASISAFYHLVSQSCSRNFACH